MDKIDHSVPIPIYYQLKLLIQQQIERGDLRPGDKIPTEEELCHRYSISRTPVRQALLELTREGILTRKTRRGTFVAPQAVKTVILRVIVPDERWQWLLDQAAHQWNDEHPQDRIALDFTIVPLAELHDQLSLAVARGQAPDISIIDSVWVAEFAHRGYLYPLDELDPTWAAHVASDFYPSALTNNSYSGRQYAVPTNVDATVLWYRRDWLAAEGLRPPVDWGELASVGQHFRQPGVRRSYGNSPHPLSFAGGKAAGETTTYQLLPLLWGAGGDIFAGGEVVLDSKANREALMFLKDLIHSRKLVSPSVTQQSWDGPVRDFAQGEVVMIFGGTYEYFLIESFSSWYGEIFWDRVGLVPIPTPPGKAEPPVMLIGGMTYGIYRQSSHPMEALALLKLVLTPSILKPFSLQTGQYPAYTPVARAIRPEDNGFLSDIAPLFVHGRNRPSLPVYDLVSRQFQEMVEMCLTEQLSIEAATRRAADRISGITGLPLA